MRPSRPILIASGAVFAAALFGLAASPAHAAYAAHVQAGALLITGDNASDKLALRLQGGSPTTLQLDVGDDGTADFGFDRTTFTAIEVHAGGGDDDLTIDQSGGTLADEHITLDGGKGDDDLQGGDGAEILFGGKGDDHVDGNRGNDLAFLGSGNDVFQWDPGDGSDTVEGQGGDNRLDFNGSNAGEQIDLSANGSRLRLLRDVGAITMDLNGLDTIAVRTLGGADTTTVGDLTASDTKHVNIDLAATGGTGDGQPDAVIAEGTDGPDKVSFANADGGTVLNGLAAVTRVTGDETADRFQAATLGGDDTATATVALTGNAAVRVDGGPGSDSVRYNGSQGDDQIAIAVDADQFEAAFITGGARFEANASDESFVVSGGDGDDTIAGQNGFAATAPLTIDGGKGDDDLQGGDGAEILFGGKGDDHVDGNRGNDLAFLGSGNDVFQWDPGDGSDTVEGQGGDNRLDFNGSNAGEQIDLSANGSRLRLSRDVGAITMDLNGLDTIAVRTLGGADTTTVGDLTASDAKHVNIDLAATGGTGDGQTDTVTATGTDGADDVDVTRTDGTVTVAGLSAEIAITGSEPALDTLHIATLGGDDDVTVARDVADVLPTTVDLGTGE